MHYIQDSLFLILILLLFYKNYIIKSKGKINVFSAWENKAAFESYFA